jgi:NitT/TauT family transport system permease protein
MRVRWPGRVGREVWISFLTVASVIALWEMAIDLHWVTSPFVVSPSTILKATIESLSDGDLLGDTAVTLRRTFAGFFAGSLLGLVVGLSMGWSRTVKALLNPVIWVIYPLPKIALLPLIMLLIGLGEPPIILIIALGAFFPVAVNSASGVAGIEPIYLDVARNYGAGRFQTFAKVLVPGSLPIIFTGLRLALGISLLLAVVAELSIASDGIGAMLWLSWETLRVERIYVAIAVIAVLGLLLNWLLGLANGYLIHWEEERS